MKGGAICVVDDVVNKTVIDIILITPFVQPQPKNSSGKPYGNQRFVQ